MQIPRPCAQVKCGGCLAAQALAPMPGPAAAVAPATALAATLSLPSDIDPSDAGSAAPVWRNLQLERQQAATEQVGRVQACQPCAGFCLSRRTLRSGSGHLADDAVERGPLPHLVLWAPGSAMSSIVSIICE